MRNNYHNPSHSEDSVTKISRSKSRNQMVIVHKLKQKQKVAYVLSKQTGWNDRFHLEQIPEYNYQNEPHSQYLKNKLRLPNNKRNDKNDLSKAKRIHQPSLDKNKVGNKPNFRRDQERQKQAINKAFTDLKQLWYEKNIPQVHMDIMTKIFNRQNYPMKILQDIKQQFSQITKQSSLIQKVMSSIDSRENCLQKINEIVKQSQKQQVVIAKLNKLFEERINHLRILTVHCIECICQWKESIEHLLPRNVKLRYIVNGKSYLLKIIDDYKQITETKLNQIYVFQVKKPDVFFLNYSFEGKKLSVVSKSILKRIRVCQMLLNEDQSRNFQDQEQNTSKRTPLIHKVKSPPIRNEKSLPSKGQIGTIQKWKKVQVQYTQFSDYFASSLAKSSFKESFLDKIQIFKYQQLTIFMNTQTSEQIVLGIDKNSSQRKIIILSLKSTLQTIQTTLKSLCEYLWQHDNCTQLRISLVHFLNGQNLSVDLQLERRIKTIGFRWISVNHSNENRMTIYSIKRPLNTIAHKTARRKQAYPIVIQHLSILNLKQNNEKTVYNKCITSTFSLINLLKEKNKDEYQQICNRDQYSHHLQCMTRIQNFLSQQAKKNGITQGFETSFTYSGLKAFQIDSQQTVNKIFRNVEISSKRLPSYYPNYISLVNSSFKFKHMTINHQKYTKFLPNKQTQILICESQYPIYLLQSDEQMINFFIIEVEQNFSMSKIDQIFHSMGEQSSFLDDFWLPVFHKTMQYIDQVGFKSSQIISTDYWSCLSSLKRKGHKKRTKIIKPPFVFGLIHKKLLQILQIPFYCTLVKKEDLI